MKDFIVLAALLLLIWFFFLRESDSDGVPCPVYEINDYRTQKQPVP